MRRNYCTLYKAILFAALTSCVGIQSQVRAEITLDGSLGPGGALPGPDFEIPAAVGEQVGGNLFHSFGVFNINTGESATFTGPGGIQNVIGRVTGGERSTIDGSLNSLVPGADLYLINPAGVMFGENAQLSVPGSFHVSTADYIRLGANGRFAATMQSSASTLTVAPPSAFGFLDNNVAPISVEAGTPPVAVDDPGMPFAVPPGETLSLIGGDIFTTDAYLLAPGRINLASVASPGEVVATPSGVDISGFERRGDIRILGGSITGFDAVTINGRNVTVSEATVVTGGILTIFADGSIVMADESALIGGASTAEQATISLRAPSLTVAEGSGVFCDGSIVIRGGHLEINGGEILANTFSRTANQNVRIDIQLNGNLIIRNGGQLASETVTGLRGADISIRAENLIVDDGLIQNQTKGDGAAGNIDVQVRRAKLTNEAGIFSLSQAVTDTGQFIVVDGAAGNVTINATESVSLSGLGTGVISQTTGTGDSGNITIITPDLDIDDRALVSSSTFGAGGAGDIKLDVDHLAIRSGRVSSSGGGRILNGQLVFMGGIGQPGTIEVTANESVTISGSFIAAAPSGPDARAGIFTNTTGQTSAGTINVSTGTLRLENGGIIESATANVGVGGNIDIHADRVILTGVADISSNSEGPGIGGDAGAIEIQADELRLLEGGTVSSASSSSGNAGNIDLRITGTLQSQNGFITTQSSETTGGIITVDAGSVQLTRGSEISASVAGDLNTTGGNVTIDGGSLVLLDRSQVNAFADEGQGGFITINSEVFLHDGASVDEVLDASSDTLGNDGVVEVNSPENDISGRITRLPASFLNAAALLSRRCAARDVDETSSFVIVGRGGVPSGPDDWALGSYGNDLSATETNEVQGGALEDRSLGETDKPGEALFTMLKLSCAR